MSYQAGGASASRTKIQPLNIMLRGRDLGLSTKSGFLDNAGAINVSRAYARTEISSYGNAAYQSRSNF